MNEYEKIAKEIRKRVSRLTLQQQRELLQLYDDTVKELAEKASKAKSKSLTERWVKDYKKELEKARDELSKELIKSIKGYTTKAAKIGTEVEQQILSKAFKLAGIDPGDHFKTMFSRVQDKVVKDIISGNLYKDKRTLSSRIWSYGKEFEKNIQYTINQAILEKKSAIELAKDLEEFVKEPAKRETTWGKVYPNLKNKRVDYNAMRLARTSINHAYQTASIQSSNMNPFVEGIEWRSALIHGRTCDLCMDRHGKIFPIDDVPLDHPNGLCTMIPYIPKSLDDVATELRRWIDGGDNPVLDDWYDKYGDYSSFKRIDQSYDKNLIGTKKRRPTGQQTRESSINEHDIGSIRKYISSDAYTINEELRNQTGLTKEQMDIVNKLDKALSKMPNYEGDLTRSLYFYSEEDIVEFLKGYEVGSIKPFNEYLSTTKGETYNPYGQVQIIIVNSKQGKDISEYNPEEQEVLYPRGTKFKILEIKKTDGKYYIVMEEYNG